MSWSWLNFQIEKPKTICWDFEVNEKKFNIRKTNLKFKPIFIKVYVSTIYGMYFQNCVPQKCMKLILKIWLHCHHLHSPIESKIRIFLTCVIYFMSNLLTYCFCFFFILNEIFDVQFQNLRYYLDINIL